MDSVPAVCLSSCDEDESRPMSRLESFLTGGALVARGTKTRTPTGPALYWAVDTGDDADAARARSELIEESESRQQPANPASPPSPTGNVRAIRSPRLPESAGNGRRRCSACARGFRASVRFARKLAQPARETTGVACLSVQRWLTLSAQGWTKPVNLLVTAGGWV